MNAKAKHPVWRRVAAAMMLALVAVMGAGCFSLLASSQDVSRLLTQKYGERFKACGMGAKNWGGLPTGESVFTFAPVSDKTLKFQVSYWDATGSMRDEYAEAICGRRISEAIAPTVGRIADGFVIESHVSHYEYDDWRDAATPEYFLANSPPQVGAIRIVIDRATLKGMPYQDEHQALCEFIDNEFPADVTITMYFVESDKMKKCKKYFDANFNVGDDFLMMMYGDPSVRFRSGMGEIFPERTGKYEYVSARESGSDTTSPLNVATRMEKRER